MDTFFSELTHWHWLVLGLLLFGIEMLTGTFDLLMVSIAAFVTAAFAAFVPQIGWEMQALVFALAAVALFLLGRTVFARLRRSEPEHPTLNKRMESLVGERGRATGDFAQGNGQVKIGDTVWGAQAATGHTILANDDVVVEDVRGTFAVVRKA
jgi:inner membrane protein